MSEPRPDRNGYEIDCQSGTFEVLLFRAGVVVERHMPKRRTLISALETIDELKGKSA